MFGLLIRQVEQIKYVQEQINDMNQLSLSDNIYVVNYLYKTFE